MSLYQAGKTELTSTIRVRLWLFVSRFVLFFSFSPSTVLVIQGHNVFKQLFPQLEIVLRESQRKKDTSSRCHFFRCSCCCCCCFFCLFVFLLWSY